MIGRTNWIKKNFKLVSYGITILLASCTIFYYGFLYQEMRTTKINGLGITMNVQNTEVSFDTKILNLGRVKQYSLSNITLNFKNIGDNALIVYDVNTSCGCVGVVEWTRLPINPGKGGYLILHLDTANPGIIDKEVSVYSNSIPNPVRLRVNAEICKEK
jgi:hypothetical protein